MLHNTMLPIDRHNKFFGINKYNLIAFMLWPMGTIIWAIKHLRSHQTKILFFLFCVYFGFVFVLPAELSGSLDAEMHAIKFIKMHENKISFDELLKSFYSENDGGNVDVVQPVIMWIVSLITGNTRVLFTIFAIVFGYFFTKNLWIIFDRLSENYKPTIMSILFIALLFLVNPIWNINGFRFYTATHVFVFGLLNLYIIGNKKGWIWILVSPLVHFSFIMIIISLLIFLVLPKKQLPLLVFFYIAFSISSINLELIQKLGTLLPIAFIQKVEFYTNPDYAKTINETQFSTHIIIARWSARLIGLFWITALFIFRKHWINKNPTNKMFFSFILFFAGIAQLMNLVPSGIRFITVFNFILFGLILIVISYDNFYRKVKFVSYISFPFIVVYLVSLIRTALEYTGFLVFIGNPVSASFFREHIPLARYIF